MTNIPTFVSKDYIGINGVGIEQLTHPHFEEWFKYIITEYEPPNPPKICLFIPCSAIKPYYGSPIHKVINKAIAQYEDNIHKIVISNAGIVPYEFSDQYPFNSYDWNPLHETEEIKNRYIELTVNRLVSFFGKHSLKYQKFISYFRPDAEELIALKVASQITEVSIIHIDANIKDCDNILHDTSDLDLVLTLEHNLNKLRHTIENTLSYDLTLSGNLSSDNLFLSDDIKGENIMSKKIEDSIEQAERFADYTIEELSKIPPNWGQVYEYIEMIGVQFSDATDAVYNMTKDEKVREELMSGVEKEDKRIKERIISTIKSVCK